MKKIISFCFLATLLSSCLSNKNESKKQSDFEDVLNEEFITLEDAKGGKQAPLWEPYNDSAEVVANATHEKEKMRFKFIQSKVLDKNEVFQPLYNEVSKFPIERYEMMKPLVLEQNILTIQSHIKAGKFSYEDLVLFYLHRIYKYELPNETTLNTVIALNPFILEEVRKLKANSDGHHPIYGMPILLKDNIGAQNMKTTAGAIALIENQTEDAFIVERLKENGALILGKVNLSEWANFLCNCPNGQSAVGGQTLNPYGRKVFDTGGSSAGSGTSIASNYAIAAIGTETSGSILSPSSQNSIVGMKPTIGLLSRSGIVPISSTLDTPGPMTKNVIDSGILLDAMRGFDEEDSKSVMTNWEGQWYASESKSLKGKRFGVFKNYMENDSLYALAITKIQSEGATIIAFEPPEVGFNGFLSILNIDMKYDLPKYLDRHVINKKDITVSNIGDLVDFNNADSTLRIPYGQERFDGILSDTTTVAQLKKIKQSLQENGRTYFNTVFNAHNLDAVLSINNYDAGAAAVAEYPALTVPMGYRPSGEPAGLTFIAKQYQEGKLYEFGAAFEALTKARKLPSAYLN